MKALSLKQPFAQLVVQGRKTIEIRKWNTKFRGEFLIHASKIPDKNAMKKYNFQELPLGKIIGRAELIDVKKYTNVKEFKRDNQLHLASPEYGNYGFILKNAQIMKPIECNGALNFWECKVI